MRVSKAAIYFQYCFDGLYCAFLTTSKVLRAELGEFPVQGNEIILEKLKLPKKRQLLM